MLAHREHALNFASISLTIQAKGLGTVFSFQQNAHNRLSINAKYVGTYYRYHPILEVYAAERDFKKKVSPCLSLSLGE